MNAKWYAWLKGFNILLLSTGAIGASCQKQRIMEIFSLYERPTFHLEWYLQSDQGFILFIFQFCNVATLTIIHKRN
jgi:hypothetical protein